MKRENRDFMFDEKPLGKSSTCGMQRGMMVGHHHVPLGPHGGHHMRHAIPQFHDFSKGFLSFRKVPGTILGRHSRRLVPWAQSRIIKNP